jgi:spore germination protein GerM
MRAARLAVIGTLVALTAGGCGLPPSGTVTRVDPTTVPYQLLESSPPNPTNQDSGGRPVRIYLVAGDRLVSAKRQVFGNNVPSAAVRSLFLGPSPLETRRGLTSDVPAQTHLISLDVRGATATLDLTSAFGTVGGTAQVLAVAQIVYTVTSTRDIKSVRISINGKPVEVPNGTGSLSSAPRSRSDYRSLVQE